ncbi:MAG TPA: maltotransferase domain-containing protein, partial [Steroidobacteraceae bacterium]
MVNASSLVAPDLRPGSVTAAIEAPRIRIERITPSVDEGRLPSKGIVGQTIAVEADIFMDGHDLLAARLIWRGPRALEEQSTPMVSLGNDRWRAQFTPAQAGRHRFNIEAWRDDWGSYRNELEKKTADGVPALRDIDEG